MELLKGTVSQDFLYPVFALISPSWSYYRCPRAVLSYRTFKMTPRCPMYRFLFLWSFKPMQQPLKKQSFKKLSNSSINYTNAFYSCLKNFPRPRTFGQLPGVPSTGESFWKSNNYVKKQKKNGPRTSLMGPGGAIWGKTQTKQSCETVPLTQLEGKCIAALK